jgi:hypothetical protein
MSTVHINDTRMAIEGKLVIGSVGGRVIVNGQDVTPPGAAGQIIISVTGDVASLEVGTCQTITVEGQVDTLSSNHGAVTCGSVGGDVTTTHGEITCGDVKGSVTTKFGSIHRR